MEEELLDAREELKRLEHIIYVSLKYTRTVDVILNALNRMVSTYDLIIEIFLEKALEEGKVDSLAKSPALRAKRLDELYEDDEKMKKYLKFYYFLKIILKLPFKRREEYRRHVTHIVELEKSTSEIDIDNLTNCEKFLHDFYNYSWKKITGKSLEPED
jgi:hypothetical protein